MYAVDFKIFNEFAFKNGLFENEQPVFNKTPFILEFKKRDVLMAKIEMSSLSEYKFLRQYPNSVSKKVNKYWIRGNEWKIKDGVQIQELSI